MPQQMHLGTKVDGGTVFKIPLDAVTQTFAFLAKRGSGKTYAASVLTEEMLGAGQQVVILDPVDVWFGLRAPAEGAIGTGLPVIVLGGSHGDLPLSAESGRMIADFVVEKKLSVVLALRHMSNAEKHRFVADFAEQIYMRKGEDKHRSPVHLMIDEADDFAPQRLFAGTERMFGAIDTLVRRGRASGIGVTLISQRAAVLNKNVLTQIEVLVTLRTISPQDRAALEAWIEAHDVNNQGKIFMDSLASLERGTAWFWSPGWLECFDKVKVRTRRTFDSSSTPSTSSAPVVPKHMVRIDLDGLKRDLATLAVVAEENDPTALKKEVATLKAKLKEAESRKPEIQIQQIGPDPEVIDHLKRVIEDALAIVSSTCSYADKLTYAHNELALLSHKINNKVPPEVGIMVPLGTVKGGFTPREEVSHPTTAFFQEPGEKSNLGRAHYRILVALAQHKTCTKNKVAILTGYSVGGGGFTNAVGALRSAGLIDGPAEALMITEAGLKKLGSYVPLPRGEKLIQYWYSTLGKASRLALEALVQAYPQKMTKKQVAEAAGYMADGGGFTNALGELRTLGLISGRGVMVASPVLFE